MSETGVFNPVPQVFPTSETITNETTANETTTNETTTNPTTINDEEVSKGILAFRLITKILARIPRDNEPFPATDNLNPKNTIGPQASWTSDNRKAIKISDAFAHLAVAEHGVVAVSTNRQPLTEDGSSVLGIVACTTPLNEPEAEEQELPTNADPGTSKPALWIVAKLVQIYRLIMKKPALNIVIAKNARKTDPENARPSIILAAPPDDFQQFADLESYVTNLVQNWKEPSLASHLWILGRLLASRKINSSNKTVHLYTYILSVCCRKINRRLTSEHSMPYFEALEEIGKTNYSYNETPSNANNSQQQTEREAVNQDHRFLRECIPFIAANPTTFVITAIPNLIQAAQDFSNGKTVQLYNPSTYQEFHRLLLEILKGYRKILSELSAMSQPTAELKQAFNKDTFYKLVIKGRLFVFVLMRIARSMALRMHLANIEHCLTTFIHAPVIASLPSDDSAEQDSENHDDELEAIRLDDGRIFCHEGLLAKMCATWVLLMIIQFDAIEICVTFVDSPTF
ncbi:hypothetical protein HYPSUDRAFT_205755 [Hypholoma sublateritium FD-334 SS-4]|uniref:Uncharacterized protein n=1 Tax=Hypholoma sublateritium (strain FD-334 SS-4) TaxID=945553 RepID=A0A0D2M4C0_HYPSF|nr:hypothetical protein HYPSUDRAFT_205755 [Hypholoma sublateritium FD-334 SS-4]